jgi:hypothetical protein
MSKLNKSIFTGLYWLVLALAGLYAEFAAVGMSRHFRISGTINQFVRISRRPFSLAPQLDKCNFLET